MNRPLSILSLCLACTAPALAAPANAAPAAPKPGADMPAPAPELFLAIGQGDLAGVKALLAAGKSANARNTIGMTALQIAAGTGNLEIVKTLLASGAQLNTGSTFGTPLTFAAFDSKPEMVQLLLTKGAHVAAERPDRISVLMLAARAGSADVVRQLLAKKADLKATDSNGSTALSYAAREGHTEVAQILLEAGAAVDVADAEGWTPLMHAVVSGHSGTAQLLVRKGASLKAADKRGRTPLLLAVSYADQPETVRALIAGGAALEAKDDKGRTPLALATLRGYTGAAEALRQKGAQTVAVTTPLRTPRQAAEASLRQVERSMEVFAKRTGCVSCHHEGIARMTTGFARAHGYTINQAFAQKQQERVLGELQRGLPLLRKAAANPAEIKNIPIVDVGDFAPTMGTVMLGLSEHKAPASESVATAALMLGRTQTPAGDWRFGMFRVPVQSSFFTTTAMAVRALQTYAPKENAEEVRERVARAKQWLLTAPAVNTEDRAFRLLGLKWAGATLEERRKAVEELRASQNPDGGWSQLPSLKSDAYATGSALFALAQGGDLAVGDPVYQKGVNLLLRTQDDDGTWFVAKRAFPGNNYFDTEFPHGQSQYVSHIGACWASMALMLAAEAPRPVASR